MEKKKNIKIIIKNKKAKHNFHILTTYEAGISLKGTEVKSIKAGKVNFLDAHASIRNGEAMLHSLHISPYSHGNRENHDPTRPRKLLLHKREIIKIGQKIKEKGFTLIPLSIYLKNGLIKVELGVAQGKNVHDKRVSLESKNSQRDMERQVHHKYL